jgi:S-adenosylmethionine synthetase
MGRINETVKKSFKSADGRTEIDLDVELFTWEKLEFVDAFKVAFNC